LHETEFNAVIVCVLDSVIVGGHDGATDGVGVMPGLVLGLGVGVIPGVGLAHAPPLRVSVVVTVVAPLYPPAAKRVLPMFVPATNERASVSDGPVDQALVPGS
jgi:hypothetical protein